MSEEPAVTETPRGPRMIEDGEFAGWMNWPHDAFETRAGPFYYRTEDSGEIVCAFRAEQKHMNGGGFMHGGCLMTFADFALFSIAERELQESYAVTLQMGSEFLDRVFVGQWMEARGEVTRAGGKTIFVRGMITADAKPVFAFTSIIRKVGKRS
ncbi:Thioesterase superfamily protein [Tsuneonella dongtanensis]|uniref:Thioesterase superfamily protein n=1 Tax=Tsuneonella dongtanensis TaxID=692370 RepID=A0A1B2AEP0_9SPHN|nr:PaaI family thioesterase [Tsuneonella dongtanensis]ANY20548.1 Thioesterase superfamily protein [Tsuneonella dongtanensis]